MNPIKAIKNIFKKNYVTSDYESGRSMSLANVYGLSNGTAIKITPRMAYNLSERNADLGKAVGDISNSVSSMRKGIRSESKGEIDYEHPVLDILRNPGGGLNRFQFWREMTESYELTNEIWLVARGNINNPPLELDFIRPYDVSVTMSDDQDAPSSITTTSNKDRRTYNRVEINGETRYIDQTSLNELLPIRGEISIDDNWRGRSKLSKLFYDILMNTDGKRHNVSLLQNGSIPSMALTPKDKDNTWNQESVTTLENYMRSFQQGAGNGRNALIIGTPTEMQFLAQSNVDMDFANLLKNSQIAIFNLYNIPLPLVLSENMTYNNFTTANRTFYDKAVFPIYDQVAEGILGKLRSRYGMSQTEVLTYDITSIPILQSVLVENMKTLNETQVVSINEVRDLGGFEEIEGGDEIFVNANQVPLSIAQEPVSFETEEEDIDSEPEEATSEG